MSTGHEIIILDEDKFFLTHPSPRKPASSHPKRSGFRPHSPDAAKKRTQVVKPSTSNLSKMSSSTPVIQEGARSTTATTSTTGKPPVARGTSDDPMVLSDYESSEDDSDGIQVLEVRNGPPRRDLHIAGVQSISGGDFYASASEGRAGRKVKLQSGAEKAPVPVKSKCFTDASGPPINHPSTLRDVFSPKKRSAGNLPDDIPPPGPSKARKLDDSLTPQTSRSATPSTSSGWRQKISRGQQQRVEKRPSDMMLDTLELTDSDDDRRTRVHKKPRRDDRNATRALQPALVQETRTDVSEADPPAFTAPSLPTRQQRLRRSPSLPLRHPGASEDGYYDFYHSGFDIHDEDNWEPIKINENKFDSVASDVSRSVRRTEEGSKSSSKFELFPRNTSQFSVQIRGSADQANFVWDKIKKASLYTYPKRYRVLSLPAKIPIVSRDLKPEFKLHTLSLQHRYRPCPRAINKIIQKDGCVVSCGACPGGGPDHAHPLEQNIDNENAPGALVVYARGSKEVILDAHKRLNFRRQGGTKYYTVNDIQFLPFSNSFLSTGTDGIVHEWDIDNAAGWTSKEFDCYSAGTGFGSTKARIPFNVVIAPTPTHASSCLVAITERKLNLYRIDLEHNQTSRQSLTEFTLKPPASPNLVGSTVWGHGATAGHLFASSEPEIPDDFSGVHKVFDVLHKRALYQLDATEGGDDSSLDPSGRTLALCTLAEGERNMLRLYDVARKSPVATTTVELEPIRVPPNAENFTKEVSCSAFSPDGIYLALGRSDNHVHLYDRRMLENGPVSRYSHSRAPNVTVNKANFGVLKAEWIHSGVTRRMGLVTAGEDGCVRLWDPMLSVENPENGSMLAQVDYDIVTFSLGDRFKQEYPLVVGDSTGQISLFDNLTI